MTKLNPGDTAPDFELPDADGKVWRLSELKGQKVIVYFYPADDTPGCTLEACDFRDSMKPLQDAGYTVLGISPQGAESKQNFTQKYGLNFPLLVDEDHAVADAYGAWGERNLYGNIVQTILRSTFIIDEEGKVADAQYNVKAKGHVGRLLDSLPA